MNKNAEMVLVVAFSLAIIGLLSGFCLALTQGIQNGDWWYMAIFVFISGLGGTAVFKVFKCLLVELVKTKGK